MARYEEAVIRVSGSYGLKTPGAVEYTSEDFHGSISVEVSTGGEFEVIEEQILEMYAKLATDAKLGVFAQAGVGFEESADGVLSPKAADLIAKSKAQAPASKAAPSGGGGGYKPGGGKKPYGGGSSAPRGNSRLGSMPKHQVTDPDGNRVTIIDQRPLKAEGEYKPTAADFKVDGEARSFWMYQKDGSPNGEVIDWLIDQGVVTAEEVA